MNPLDSTDRVESLDLLSIRRNPHSPARKLHFAKTVEPGHNVVARGPSDDRRLSERRRI